MAVDDLLEWRALGARLQILCPAKFAEIVDCLRDTVGVHEILAPVDWTLDSIDSRGPSPAKG